MRSRLAVPASLLAALVAVAITATAAAAPQRNHHLTINATPNPIVTGDEVLIYGQLNVAHRAHRLIVLYHRINPARRFTIVQTAFTDAAGFYEFRRAEGVVKTNRSWFVTSPAGTGTHSRTVHERVAAAVTLTTATAGGLTNHPITFAGTVQPAGVHTGERVVLQERRAETGDDWATIGRGTIGGDGSFTIVHNFRQPGTHEVRALFRGDARNVKAASDSLAVTVQQTQNPTFTITSSAPDIDYGQPVTISGVLYAPGSTTTGLPGVNLTLWGHEAGGPYVPLGSTVTGADGSYSFTQVPAHNTVYQVRTTFTPPKRRLTAQLFEGVRDVVSLTADSTTSTVGGRVTFRGNVTPDKAGHVIYLQRLGADGDWHTAKTGTVDGSSSYTFTWTFGTPGTKRFRVHIPGGDINVGGSSAPVDITVTLPPVASLPPAS